jgi:hypothetical protein
VDFLGSIIGSIGFTDPVWFLVVIPFILILGWELSNRRKNKAINLTDLEYLRINGCITGRKRRRVRALLWIIMVFAIATLCAGPSYRSDQSLFLGGEQVVYQKFLLMLDISRSMSVPLGEEKNVSLPGQVLIKRETEGELIPRYQAARAALMDFVKRFHDAQIGLILFSAEPILARWPTVETKDLFWEILEEDIGRGIISQTQSFSSLTNTDKALTLAREIFAKQGAREGAVILISDAEDDIENMGVASRNLRIDGIRLYTIGVGISEQIAENLSQKFSHDPGFRIFHVDSEEEMLEAYKLVAEVEESLPFELNQREYENDLRWFLSLCLVIAAGLFFWILEVGFHQSQVAGETGQEQGRRRGFWFS